MISNPPYGKKWTEDKGLVAKQKTMGFAGKDENLQRLLTNSSDGQLMFMLNNLSKMHPVSEQNPFGSRIVEVHNGSALFTGEAGQGMSNIRQLVFGNDWVDAIIALPENIFYNTGIGTFIWVLSNCKTEGETTIAK